MLRSEIQVGKIYKAKISGRLVPVRIDAERPQVQSFRNGRNYQHGGWDATNTLTNRKIHIRTAAKLRGEMEQSKAEDIVTARHPGMCYSCGTPIYVGDKIRLKEVAGNQVAEHATHSL